MSLAEDIRAKLFSFQMTFSSTDWKLSSKTDREIAGGNAYPISGARFYEENSTAEYSTKILQRVNLTRRVSEDSVELHEREKTT